MHILSRIFVLFSLVLTVSLISCNPAKPKVKSPVDDVEAYHRDLIFERYDVAAKRIAPRADLNGSTPCVRKAFDLPKSKSNRQKNAPTSPHHRAIRPRRAPSTWRTPKAPMNAKNRRHASASSRSSNGTPTPPQRSKRLTSRRLGTTTTKRKLGISSSRMNGNRALNVAFCRFDAHSMRLAQELQMVRPERAQEYSLG